ncbi:MAG: FUSC family protein [Clostridiales bacterium]|nr:FUSC family protein [Clostridiales bacterium]
MKIKLHKLGMRTIKTAMAVAITLLICDILNITNPFFAAIAAIIAMESSISATFSTVKDRIYGTILGAILALVFSWIFPINWLSMGFGILIVIYVCNQFGWQGTIKISTIVFIAVLLGYEAGNRWEYAVFRIIDTTIGLTIGTIINYYVFPHNMGGEIYRVVDDLLPDLNKMLETIGSHEENFELDTLRSELSLLEDRFNILKKDIKLHVNPAYDSETFKAIIDRLEMLYVHLAVIDNLSHHEGDAVIMDYHTKCVIDIIVAVNRLKHELDQI